MTHYYVSDTAATLFLLYHRHHHHHHHHHHIITFGARALLDSWSPQSNTYVKIKRYQYRPEHGLRIPG